MTFKINQIFLLIVWIGILPFVANGATKETIAEKQIKIIMRIMGHEILKCVGDETSRVLPIEKKGAQYKISFEAVFGFEPDDAISIINRLMKEHDISKHYFVEVEQCKTGLIMHSFEISYASSMIPCTGRALPQDCYSFLITILNNAKAITDLPVSDTKKVISFNYLLLFIPVLILLSFTIFFINKKNSTNTNPNLTFIGATQFDKKNMILSFENKNIELSNKEAALLALLNDAVNKPIKREVILQEVWSDEGDYVGRTLDVFISKLRKKLSADTSIRITNIRGIGYKLVINMPKQNYWKKVLSLNQEKR